MTEAVEGDFTPQEKVTLTKQAEFWLKLHDIYERILAAVKQLNGLVNEQAKLWLRIAGHLEHLLTAVKHTAAVVTKMESRINRGPPDFEMGPQRPWINVDYGDRNPAPRDPNRFQTWMLGVVGTVVGLGIPSIGGILWSMNTKLAEQAGQTNLTIQRLDQVDVHLKATDQRVDGIEREIWPHKH